MTGYVTVLCVLRHGERRLNEDFLALADRHRAEHEIHHVATDLARWSHEHAQRLENYAITHGLDIESDPPESFAISLTPLTEETTGCWGEPGLLLLKDMRALHLSATETSVHWEMLAQAAQALKNQELLALASACHPQTVRQVRWTNTMIKNLSPQILTVSVSGASGHPLG